MKRVKMVALALLLITQAAILAAQPQLAERNVDPHAQQISNLLHLEKTMQRLRELQSARACGASATLEELSLRQDLSDAALAASFDVDGVEAEIQNERALLMETRIVLGNKRDRAVNLMNIANLVTGTGVGIAVNAMQFSSTTANTGNSLGVGSGITSTILSIIGIRKQRGSTTAIGRVPNMLAPLFDRPAVLNSAYPDSIRTYLNNSPSPNSATRLESLKSEWIKTGHLPEESDKSYEQHLKAVTASEDPKVKVTIDDITDRIAMLTDVSGRAALMKRDLALMMRSLNAQPCSDAR